MLRLALGAGLVVSGAFAGSCSKPNEESSPSTRRPATSSTLAATASVSCSASEHIEPHILPSDDNVVGGKMKSVDTKGTGKSPKPCVCPPGVPLCEC